MRSGKKVGGGGSDSIGGPPISDCDLIGVVIEVEVCKRSEQMSLISQRTLISLQVGSEFPDFWDFRLFISSSLSPSMDSLPNPP